MKSNFDDRVRATTPILNRHKGFFRNFISRSIPHLFGLDFSVDSHLDDFEIWLNGKRCLCHSFLIPQRNHAVFSRRRMS